MLIPQLLDVLEKSELLKNVDLSYIKTVGCGGLAITEQFEKRVNDFFINHNMDTFLGYGWGCTENSSSAAIRSNFDTSVIGTVGAPQINTIVASFDPDSLEEKGYEEEGELCIFSPNLMLGYYQDDEMTNSVLKKHGDGSVWLHTGDLGVVDNDGIVKVNGRMTRTIFVYPTAKIYPTAMENVISQVPGVADVIVGEIEDKNHPGFGLPVCFAIPTENANLSQVKETINVVCEKVFADYARPQEIYFMDEFPLTKVGKKDVKILEKKFSIK
jgi:long-chain acyl-CoA synthetase